MARKIGYARVSTTDQDLTVQEAALEREGCALVLKEKFTGTRREGREQLDMALKILSEGDVLVVTRLDRLGRSLRDLANIVHEIEGRGAALRVTEQSVDTSTTAGRAFFGMLAVFAQFETDVRRERQAEGIALAKGKGKYTGRKPTARMRADEVMELHRLGVGVGKIKARLGLSRSSIYRIINDPV